MNVGEMSNYNLLYRWIWGRRTEFSYINELEDEIAHIRDIDLNALRKEISKIIKKYAKENKARKKRNPLKPSSPPKSPSAKATEGQKGE